MEPNDELNTETNPEEQSGTLPEGRYNLEICPNCLEPNEDDLAVCRYCGQPLNPDAEPADTAGMPENEKTLAENRAAAVPEKKPQKKQESGFRRVMPWIGLYLMYYAITGVIETAHTEELANVKLAYASWAIWFAAGVLMAWPLLKKGYRKLRRLPEEDETPAETPESENAEETAEASENTAEQAAEELPEPAEAAPAESDDTFTEESEEPAEAPAVPDELLSEELSEEKGSSDGSGSEKDAGN